MKVLDYEFLSAGHPDDLTPQVKALIQEGWEPYGAPVCPNSGPFAQAMVRPLPKPEPIKGVEVDRSAPFRKRAAIKRRIGEVDYGQAD